MNNKRNVLLLNVALLACALWMGWTFYHGWTTAADGLSATGGGAGLGNRYALPADSVVSASGSQVIARNPFSRDRSIIVEEPAVAVASGPPPQLPVVIGTMRLRDHYEALLAENAQNAGSAFKQVKVGEVFAGYKIAEIRDDEVVVELNGQKSSINVYLSASNVVRNSARTEAVPVAAKAPRVDSAASQPTVTSASAAAPAAAPVQLPSPDPLLKITVEGNRRRYERTTMFGPQIWYEDIK